ncbi:MAG: nucleotidyl transferase AbiEii/AbiGii toxin family protein [Chitinophagaceae bacterium]|nr:nucleotidyl transferase AbiEii/AbiGii toxin family protein [Chitinophagaceae bacterium]
MSEAHYLNKLYPLQDKVLQLFSANDLRHYLTGGTALSRAFFHHRWSDDLDLFLNNDAAFEKETEKAIRLLEQNFNHVSVDNQQAGFARIFITEHEQKLKLDFVNDVAYHVNGFEATALYHKMDNPLNILSNKVAALNRQAAKDVAGKLFICQHYSFSWPDIINDATQKDNWVNEVDVLTALKVFDLEKLQTDVSWVKKPDAGFLQQITKKILFDIASAGDNTIVGLGRY